MMIPSTHLSLLRCLTESERRNQAWTEFENRYRTVIRTWCLHRGLPPEDADDLTQDILLKLLEQLPHYRQDPTKGRFRSWLKAVVNNAITDAWRRERHRAERRGVGGTAFLRRLAELQDPEAAAELSGLLEDHVETTAGQVLENVRTRLKESTWQAFYQTMVEGRPAAQVAAELGLSIATVYKATYRVKQMLVEEYCHAYPSD